jgi:anti-sigma factor RsiW
VKGFAGCPAYLNVGRKITTKPVPSDPRPEAAAMTARTHPDDETLTRFVLGRLDRKLMAQVEGHLHSCSRCGQVAMRVPDDRLVKLLRTSTTSLAAESPADDTPGSLSLEAQGPFRKSSAGKSPGQLGRLVLLACLAGVVGSSVSGCSGAGGTAELSPEARAKAKENFKKRSSNTGAKINDRKTSR